MLAQAKATGAAHITFATRDIDAILLMQVVESQVDGGYGTNHAH